MRSESRQQQNWVQQVTVEAEALETRLEVARSRGLSPEKVLVAAGVEALLRRARGAALHQDPGTARWWNWWRGSLVEAAYRNLHAARAQIVELYEDPDLMAEVPGAVARAQLTIRREDPRRITESELVALSMEKRPARLRSLIEDGYELLDQRHAQLRAFRNIVLMSALLITLLLTTTVGVVSVHPTLVPMCFPSDSTTSSGALDHTINCPTGAHADAPTGGDILIVALLGLCGGALAASFSIRNLRGSATPYDIPLAIALLQVPCGAYTAILGLIAIQGDLIPGVSVLDSQAQILAIALILGLASQVITFPMQARARSLLDFRGSDAGPDSRETSEIPPTSVLQIVGGVAALALSISLAGFLVIDNLSGRTRLALIVSFLFGLASAWFVWLAAQRRKEARERARELAGELNAVLSDLTLGVNREQGDQVSRRVREAEQLRDRLLASGQRNEAAQLTLPLEAIARMPSP